MLSIHDTALISLSSAENSRPGRQGNAITTSWSCVGCKRGKGDGLLQGVVGHTFRSARCVAVLTQLKISTCSNARTASFQPSTPIPTTIVISPDRTFTFSTRSPPVTHLLRTAAGIEKGSATAPPRGVKSGHVGKISVKQVYEIAKIKMMDEDLKVLGLEKIARTVVGSAKSLGLEVVV